MVVLGTGLLMLSALLRTAQRAELDIAHRQIAREALTRRFAHLQTDSESLPRLPDGWQLTAGERVPLPGRPDWVRQTLTLVQPATGRRVELTGAVPTQSESEARR